jgi:hypothetical protein
LERSFRRLYAAYAFGYWSRSRESAVSDVDSVDRAADAA